MKQKKARNLKPYRLVFSKTTEDDIYFLVWATSKAKARKKYDLNGVNWNYPNGVHEEHISYLRTEIAKRIWLRG